MTYSLQNLAELSAAFPWFFYSLAFVLGAIVGSFLNVCIYRIPEEKSIVYPGSHCACGKPIAWYDNIPILSWFILRGRSRCCGQRFSFRYPAVEMLTGAIFLACWASLPPASAISGMVFASLLICGSFIDLDHMIIPDRFSIGTAVVGLVLSGAFPSLHGYHSGAFAADSLRSLFDAGLGMLIGSGVIAWIAFFAEAILRKEAMGLGDVKLLGAIGTFTGWQGAVFAIFGGAVLGSLAVAVALLIHGLFGKPRSSQTVKDDNATDAEADAGPQIFGTQIPFGPMLATGGFLYFLWLKPFVDAYFDNLRMLF